MKLLQITRTYYPSIGGIESVTNGLSRALQQLGHQTDILTLRYIFDRRNLAAHDEQHQGLQIYRLPHIGSRRYPITPGVFAFARYYDLLHIHAIDFFIDYLSLTSAIHRRPIVVNTHGGIFHTRWLTSLKRIWFAAMTRLSLRRVAAVICDSEHDYQLFQQIVPTEKLHIIRNGVNVQPFLSTPKQIIPGLLVGVGRVVENKRIDQLIMLLARLSETVPEAQLVWIGDDANRQVPSLMVLAQRFGVAARVKFIGQVTDMDLYQLLAQANLFVSTSQYEAFGISTIEAMASGTVPVVTSVGIHSEVIRMGHTGFFISGHDCDADIAVLLQALNLAPEELSRMESAVRSIAQQYAWNQVVQHYVRIYDSALIK